MTPIVARLAIAIGGSMEASIVLKATLVLVLTLAAVRLAPRARASIRHIVLAAAFCVLLTLPTVAVLLPPVVVHIPVSTIGDAERLNAGSCCRTVGVRNGNPETEPVRLPWIPEGTHALRRWLDGDQRSVAMVDL
jgi:hypothetical protein